MPISFVSLFLVIIISFFSGWLVNGWRLSSDYSDLIRVIAERSADQERLNRETEGFWHERVEEIHEEYRRKIELVAADLHRAADDRLQEYAANYARRSAEEAGDSGECKAAVSASGVLAKLLGEADRMAEAFAGHADRSRLAGQACEEAYRGTR